MNDSVGNLKVYLLCRYALESSLYNTWLGGLPFDYEAVQECPSDWRVPDDAGIVITHEHYRWEEISALSKICNQKQVPTLVLADGVLEYRNTWSNPTIPNASIYQPLMADKIACIGLNSARMIESWGNQGKTEVVGLPRLDALIDRARPDDQGSKFKLLVATATTPAFNSAQRQTVVNSLLAVKTFLDCNSAIGEKELEVNWRLTDRLDGEIGVDSEGEGEASLAESIESSNAVITTPSTIYLESALLRRPTAILDFSNSPQFVPAAWTISSSDQVQDTIEELVDPPEAKLHYQLHLLHYNLACQTPAAERMVKLITRMIEIGYHCRAEKKPLQLPAGILNCPQESVQNNQPNLAGIYPDNEAFKHQEVPRLQAELSQAITRLGALPRELADKNNQITQLQSALDESRRRVADVRSRLMKLRKILGIGKENRVEDEQNETGQQLRPAPESENQ